MEVLIGPNTSIPTDPDEPGNKNFLRAKFLMMKHFEQSLVDAAVMKHMYKNVAYKPKPYATSCLDMNCNWLIVVNMKGNVAVSAIYHGTRESRINITRRARKLVPCRWVAQKYKGLFKENDVICGGQIEAYMHIA